MVTKSVETPPASQSDGASSSTLTLPPPKHIAFLNLCLQYLVQRWADDSSVKLGTFVNVESDNCKLQRITRYIKGKSNDYTLEISLEGFKFTSGFEFLDLNKQTYLKQRLNAGSPGGATWTPSSDKRFVEVFVEKNRTHSDNLGNSFIFDLRQGKLIAEVIRGGTEGEPLISNARLKDQPKYTQQVLQQILEGEHGGPITDFAVAEVRNLAPQARDQRALVESIVNQGGTVSWRNNTGRTIMTWQ